MRRQTDFRQGVPHVLPVALRPSSVSPSARGQIRSEPTLAHCCWSWRGGYTYVATIDPFGGGRIDACVLLPGAG
jgi:hypothetical protein